EREILEGFLERKLGDVPVAAVRLPVMADVAAFPELIERQRIDVRRVRLFQNYSERLRIYWRRVDEGAVNVERQQLVHARSLRRTVSSLRFRRRSRQNDPHTVSSLSPARPLLVKHPHDRSTAVTVRSPRTPIETGRKFHGSARRQSS